MVQWLRLHAPNAGGPDCKEDPTCTTKTWHSQPHLKKRKEKAKTEYKLFRLKKDPENDQNPVNLS